VESVFAKWFKDRSGHGFDVWDEGEVVRRGGVLGDSRRATLSSGQQAELEPRARGVPESRLWPRLQGRCVHLVRSRSGKRALTAGSGAVALAVALLGARRFADSAWPLSKGHPALLVSVGLLFLLASAFKAYGWGRLFAVDERPQPIALAAALLVASGVGASQAVGVAVAGQALSVMTGGAILLFATAWRTGLRLATVRAAA
jgi:hypothetical protein